MHRDELSFCLVTDSGFRPEDEFLPTIEAVLTAGATMIQYREKSGRFSDREIYLQALEVAALCRRFGVPLLVDDRLDLAMAVGADGLHLGQKDLPLDAVKRLWPQGRIFGVSVSRPEEIARAEADGADYLGIGAFPTETKKDYSSVGSDGVSLLLTKSRLPVIAIGGITAGNTPGLIRAGCAGVAVVSAVWRAPDPGAAATEILAAVQTSRGTQK
ncbi:thiamine phosphate synthase [Marispirochaeta sp.]|jgi:thiamine-phosphate pyrophosphorylase|uniref:thiamine phosphate synthase n=1 Tax=Marispirochaeta sp. TaxID=2038653 RepID=UPI0029C8E83B|nr:thiamine phosphate synthase [Marispirochaeta sp.]